MIFILAFVSPAAADTVYLKSGRQLSGVIEQQSSDQNRLALRSAGALIYVQRDMIDRVEKRPQAELEGDAAVTRGDLDAALDSYQRALAELPNDPQLRHKLNDVKNQLVERDRKRYGARFDAIEQALARGDNARALQQARDLDKQVQEASTHRRLQTLMSRACMGLALDARNRFNMKEAEDYYKQAIRVAPHYPPPYLELARIYEQQAPRRAAAIVLYEQALEQALKQPDQITPELLMATRFRLGQLLAEQGRSDDSLRQMLELLRRNQLAAYPQIADYLMQDLARIYADDGARRAGEVLGYLAEIIQRKPAESRALALVGRIQYEQGNIDQAKATFERTMSITGKDISSVPYQDAAYYLGMIARQRGDLDRAVALLDPIANNQTGHYNALCELGEIKLDQALYAQAVDKFRMARLLHSDRFRASLGMGQALVQLKRYDEAREYLKEVLVRDPENIKALTALAQSYFEEKKFKEVLDAAGKVTQIIETEAAGKPDADQTAKLVNLHVMLGTANTRLNQAFMAVSHFEKAIKLKPDYAVAFNGIGEAYWLNNRYDKAEDFFKKAMAADPRNPQYPLNMALNWHKYRQEPRKALPYYEMYFKLGGRDPSVRQWYAEAGGSAR
ncbi:MAG: tetratricopeptide repeat protein [Candidatus Sumerlaeia bacterium]